VDAAAQDASAVPEIATDSKTTKFAELESRYFRR